MLQMFGRSRHGPLRRRSPARQERYFKKSSQHHGTGCCKYTQIFPNHLNTSEMTKNYRVTSPSSSFLPDLDRALREIQEVAQFEGEHDTQLFGDGVLGSCDIHGGAGEYSASLYTDNVCDELGHCWDGYLAQVRSSTSPSLACYSKAANISSAVLLQAGPLSFRPRNSATPRPIESIVGPMSPRSAWSPSMIAFKITQNRIHGEV